LCFSSRIPNGGYLILDLFDFILVSTAFVVRDLGFELGDLLGVLPVRSTKQMPKR